MKEKILIVEDDLDVLERYKDQLKFIKILYKKEFDATIAISKIDAEKYLNEKFDYAILDGLGGGCFELYEKINANKKIIVSGNPFTLNKCKERSLEHLSKPISLSEILK